jgi:hypothetical protein
LSALQHVFSLNTQPARLTLNLASLPMRPKLPKLAPADDEAIERRS